MIEVEPHHEDNDSKKINFKLEDAEESETEDQIARYQQVKRTVKNDQWKNILATSLIGIVFCGYFLQLYIYNS